MTAASSYTLYHRLPGLVLGFHGCDKSVGESVLCGDQRHLKQSKNPYDWLGDGIYFWENDPQRAFEFARKQHEEKKPGDKGYIAEPFVFGAILDLGFCLNLTERRALDEVRLAYTHLVALKTAAGEPMPVNRGRNHGARYLDRAVIQTLHDMRQALNEEEPGAFPPYDSVRSPFPEGDKLFDGSDFQAENHIQIAICHATCIKGYFRPIPD